MKNKRYGESKKIRKAQELLKVALEINSLQARDKAGKPTVFLDYSGHVSLIVIRVFPHGWLGGPGVQMQVPLNRDPYDFCPEERSIDEAIKELKIIRREWA